MKLTEEIKNKIKEEYESWFEGQYGGVDKKRRKELGAIFTPPNITIEMIEMFDNLDGNILDPCCGSGNLLVACILAGADPNNIYGNEFEQEFVELAQDRLEKYGVPRWHIHRGDATKKECISFNSFRPDYVYGQPKQISLWDI